MCRLCFLRTDHKLSIWLRVVGVSWPWIWNVHLMPLCYHFCFVTWCSVIWANAQIVTKLHVDLGRSRCLWMAHPLKDPNLRAVVTVRDACCNVEYSISSRLAANNWQKIKRPINGRLWTSDKVFLLLWWVSEMCWVHRGGPSLLE